MKSLAGKMKMLREGKGFSQTMLAKKADVAQSIISSVENGERIPRADTLSKIAIALETTTSFLLGEV